MEASGRVSSLNTLQIVGSIHDHPVSDDDGEPCNSVLSDEQLFVVRCSVSNNDSKYKNLSNQYKAALQKAKNARRKSTFPPRSEWELQQYPAGSSERNMGNSMPNQHKKMTTPSDFHETWYICTLCEVINSQ